jgi:hypothetical protein
MALANYWNDYGETILNFGLVPVPRNSGIGSNTYRTLHTLNTTPQGEIKRQLNFWADDARHLLEIEDDYRVLHNSLIENFNNYAEDNIAPLLNNKGLNQLRTFAFPRKMVDLFVKQQAYHVHFNEPADQNLRYWLLSSAFQPLDKHSLSKLRDIYQLLNVDGAPIPPHVGMGYVEDQDQYDYFQEKIREICLGEGVPKFAFDYWVWNAPY